MRIDCGFLSLLICSIHSSFSGAVISDELDRILLEGVNNKVYPGAVAIVGNRHELLYQGAVGCHSYDLEDTKMSTETMFDLASLTKVVSTTTAVALLVEHNYLHLDTFVKDVLGDDFANGGKQNIKIIHCLLHNAGFNPDPVPWYWDVAFGCPNTADNMPQEDFSCLNPYIYFDSFMNEKLNTAPGEVYVYSDLSFITLQMVVGMTVLDKHLVPSQSVRDCVGTSEYSGTNRVTGRDDAVYNTKYPPSVIVCAFEAFVRMEIFTKPILQQTQNPPLPQSPVAAGAEAGAAVNAMEAPLPPSISVHSSTSSTAATGRSWMPNTTYLPDRQLWSNCAPTLNDTGDGSYTHRRLQGQVADGDCYAMGGIAGHAGVFSTATDVAAFAQYMLQQRVKADRHNDAEDEVPVEGGKGPPQKDFSAIFELAPKTVKLFTTIHNSTQSSRALGWSTNSLESADFGYDHSCGTMSTVTFMHTGYTGTCLCVDPKNDLFSVVLTNRIYNCQGQLCPAGSSDDVKKVYRKFHTAVVANRK